MLVYVVCGLLCDVVRFAFDDCWFLFVCSVTDVCVLCVCDLLCGVVSVFLMVCVFVCGRLKVSVWFVCDVLYGAVWCIVYGDVFVCGLFKSVCFMGDLLCDVV